MVVRKWFLVTGGSSGVGRAVAAGLAARGAGVILLSRNAAKAEKARRELERRYEGARIELLSADLADPSSVREVPRCLQATTDRLDGLVLCAGVLEWSRRENRDGVELTLATEFVGHFLLTDLLLRRLRDGAPARILTVAGAPREIRRARIRFDDLQLRRHYSPLTAKLQAARAKAVFTLRLARRLEGSGVTANVFHTGHLVRSGMVEGLPGLLRMPARLGMSVVGRTELPDVAALADAPEWAGVNGRFIVGRKTVELSFTEEEADRLWEVGERLAGLRPGS